MFTHENSSEVIPQNSILEGNTGLEESQNKTSEEECIANEELVSLRKLTYSTAERVVEEVKFGFSLRKMSFSLGKMKIITIFLWTSVFK
jgi:hypothetical protein